MDHDSFPRQQARTQRFTLGRPRSFTISPAGDAILFVRSRGGADRVGCLWQLDAATGEERELVVPTELLAGGDEDLPAQEQARRERMREAAAGVVSYTTDRDCSIAVYALSGRLFVTDVASGASRELPAQTPVVDPRTDPNGQYVAYCSGGSLRLISTDGTGDRALVQPTSADSTWGLADFIGAEELGRSRGFWWSPDGDGLLVEHVDQSLVDVWWVSDPAHPGKSPVAQRYPSAGTTNATVSLWHVPLDGEPILVEWDTDRWEYLACVHWSERGAPLVQLLTRDQQESVVGTVDVSTGRLVPLRTYQDPHWVDVHPGVPAWNSDGDALLTIEAVDDHYALCVDGQAVTPVGLQVRAVVDVGTDVLFLAQEHPTQQHVWSWDGDNFRQVSLESGVHTATRVADGLVLNSADLHARLPSATYRTASGSGRFASVAEEPGVLADVSFLPGGADDLRVAVLLPSTGETDAGPLPVLLDPYGGPHGQQVLATQGAFRESQWWADQGFAVVVVDGRGTPGSPSWERAIDRNLAEVVLQDQITGLHAAAHAYPQMDLSRVGIRGWSFGGYLAALAVLERPDIFHAAVAGAPVTDWRLYDTAYTERYLGRPADDPEAYRKASLLERAAALSRPLMMIHGIADDNVFVAHTLQLSARLTQAGRPHSVLPLSGVTHMASQEDVAVNLLRLQVDFLRRALIG